MKVIWRKRSGDDLDAALAYIAKESPSAARLTHDRMLHLSSNGLMPEGWVDALMCENNQFRERRI